MTRKRALRAPLWLRLLSGMHCRVYRFTSGRLGGRMAGVPALLLTTAGRRTGRPHTVPLMYVRDGERLLVVASNGGRDWHPAWWLNLRTTGAADVQVGRDRRTFTAQEARGDERDRLWSSVVKTWPGYADYQKRTKRPIPLVVLSAQEPNR